MEHGVRQMGTLDAAVTGVPSSMVEHNADRSVSGDFADRMRIGRTLAVDKVRQAQADMEDRASLNQEDYTYTVGEKAYMATSHITLPAWSVEKVHKLRNKFFGPWEVVKVWSPQAVELKIPKRLLPRMHRVIHPKYLKKWTPGGEARVLVPDIDAALAESPIMVEEILGQREYYSKRQYLVRWAGWSTSEATWEGEDELLENPKLALYLSRKARVMMGTAPEEQEEGMAGGIEEKRETDDAARRFSPSMLAAYREQVQRVRSVSTYGKRRSGCVGAASLSCS